METNLVALPIPGPEALQLTWEFIVPVVVPVIVALVRRFVPTMPKLYVVGFAVVLGVLSVYLLSLSGWAATKGGPGGYALMLVLGVAAIGVREIFKQVMSALGLYPATPGPTPTPAGDSGTVKSD